MMAATMNLLVIAHTGHVVAGLTRVAGGPDLEPAAVAGTALPVRSIRDQTSSDMPFAAWLPSSVLEVKSAPLDPRVLASPQDYVIDGGVAIRIAAAAPAATVSGLTTGQVVIDQASGQAKQKVLAVVAAMDDQQGAVRVQAGAYPEPLADLALPLTILPDDVAASIPPGDYGVMVALAGTRLHWTTETVP
jgi:hypothetical protein